MNYTNKPILIGICGGSCSGKTYISKYLQKYYSSSYISQDNYFKDLSLCENRIETIKNTNFDCPNAYDIDLFIDHLNKLFNGKIINSPIYRFSDSTRSGYKKIVPTRVIIVDGIMMLYNRKIRDLLHYTVFVDCDDDIRLSRRIKRDIKERGYDLDLVLYQYFDTVKPMKSLYIDPHISKANIKINNNINGSIKINNIINDINKLILGKLNYEK